MPQPPSKQPVKAAWMLVMATFLWGQSFPFMKGLEAAQDALRPGLSSLFHAALVVGYRFAL